MLSTAGALNESDYEAYTYNANSNRTSLRKRDTRTITYSYDTLNRLTYTDAPAGAVSDVDVGNSYDLAGRLIQATDTNGHYNKYSYDNAGRVLSEQSLYGGTKDDALRRAGPAHAADLGGRVLRNLPLSCNERDELDARV